MIGFNVRPEGKAREARELVRGAMQNDSLTEQAFMYVGSVDEAVAKGKKLQA